MNKLEKYQDFDFIKFTWFDTNGAARCRVITRRALEWILETGIGITAVFAKFGVNSTSCKFSKMDEGEKSGSPSVFLTPVFETFHACPWSGNGKHKVAEFICQIHEQKIGDEFCYYDTRQICVKLLDQLQSEFGLKLYSSFEYEFLAMKGGQLLGNAGHSCSSVILKNTEDLCYEISSRLSAADIAVEAINTEAGDGQLEITMEPTVGIQSADNACLYKDCVKSTAVDLGYTATFMCSPFPKLHNGGHFNFSLQKDGKNVFTDNSDELGLSQLGKFWLNGILKHARAIAPLLNPNNNSYLRLYPEVSSDGKKINYGKGKRHIMIRVKRTKNYETYMEFRSPGASANAYLVLSAVLAAGMDGMRQKNLLPEVSTVGTDELPRTLREAVLALEQDDVIKSALGNDFVELFLAIKRQKDMPITDPDEQFRIYSQLL